MLLEIARMLYIMCRELLCISVRHLLMLGVTVGIEFRYVFGITLVFSGVNRNAFEGNCVY